MGKIFFKMAKQPRVSHALKNAPEYPPRVNPFTRSSTPLGVDDIGDIRLTFGAGDYGVRSDTSKLPGLFQSIWEGSIDHYPQRAMDLADNQNLFRRLATMHDTVNNPVTATHPFSTIRFNSPLLGDYHSVVERAPIHPYAWVEEAGYDRLGIPLPRHLGVMKGSMPRPGYLYHERRNPAYQLPRWNL